MGSTGRWVIPLSESATVGEELVGGKARTLGGLLRDGWRVPPGVVVSTLAYDRFRRDGDLERRIRMELGRKPFGRDALGRTVGCGAAPSPHFSGG